MQHIQQQGENECGVACIAMAANVPYHQVKAFAADEVKLGGITPAFMHYALEEFSQQPWDITQLGGHQTLGKCRKAGVVLVVDHWVVISEGMAYDPDERFVWQADHPGYIRRNQQVTWAITRV